MVPVKYDTRCNILQTLPVDNVLSPILVVFFGIFVMSLPKSKNKNYQKKFQPVYRNSLKVRGLYLR